jgi:hypothetical protein
MDFANRTCAYIMNLENSLESFAGIVYTLVRSIEDGNPYPMDSIKSLIEHAIIILPEEYKETITYQDGIVNKLYQLTEKL